MRIDPRPILGKAFTSSGDRGESAINLVVGVLLIVLLVLLVIRLA